MVVEQWSSQIEYFMIIMWGKLFSTRTGVGVLLYLIKWTTCGISDSFLVAEHLRRVHRNIIMKSELFKEFLLVSLYVDSVTFVTLANGWGFTLQSVRSILTYRLVLNFLLLIPMSLSHTTNTYRH